MRTTTLSCLLATLTACGMSGADSSGASGDGTDNATDPGHGVSFGGAQDIGELRGILDAGGIPGADTLDANGFFNEHYNAPPAAPCGATLCLTAGVAVGTSWLTGGYQAALQLAVSTNVDPATYTRLPMSLVVVVDHSGSMAQDGRLTKVKAGIDTLIDQLHPEDRLAIVSFDDEVTIDAPFAAELDRAHLHAVVAAIQPDGSTNLYAGLETGLNLLGDEPSSERQNRVIFLSDGLATAGNTDETAITEMATSHIARGIGLTTIGVGADFDVQLMRGLAERGAGNFYFVEDAAAATEVFTEELDYFLSPIALDIRLDATAAPGWDFGDAVGSSLWVPQNKSGSMAIPAVFLASRTTQSPGETGGRRGGGSMIFVGITPSTAVAGKVADLQLSYRVPGSQERTGQTVALHYAGEPGVTPPEAVLSYPQLAERYAMYNMYLGLRTATEQAEGNYGCAVAALTSTRAAAQSWLQTHEEDQDLAADVALFDQFLANLAAAGAPAADAAAQQCSYGPDGGYADDGGWYGDDTAGCSAGGPTSMLPIGFAIALLAMRRRRRCAS